jgi:hypothetical protein
MEDEIRGLKEVSLLREDVDWLATDKTASHYACLFAPLVTARVGYCKRCYGSCSYACGA